MAQNFDIKEHIATIRTNDKGQALEINKVSWYNKEAKVDIRYWEKDGEGQYMKPGKGLTLTETEFKDFKKFFKELKEE